MPPGGNGFTMEMGRLGYGSWADRARDQRGEREDDDRRDAHHGGLLWVKGSRKGTVE